MQLFFYLTSVFFLITPFVSNATFRFYLPFIIFFTSLIFFVIFLIRDRYTKINLNSPNTAFALFIIANIVILFDSYNINSSLHQILFYLQCFFIFIILQQISSRNLLIFVSKTFVILSTIFGLFSITYFIEIGLTASHRLGGIVGPAGVYSGFLILPLLLCAYFLYTEKQIWFKRLWYLAIIILFTSYFLTFAYDSWISLLLAVIVVGYTLRNNYRTFELKKLVKPILIVATFSFVFFCSVWYMAKENTLTRQSQSLEVTQYEKQNFENSFLGERASRYTNALTVFFYSPINGFGANSYKFISKFYENGSNFSDPYNWFLKMLAEHGIFGLIFVYFIVSFLVKIAKQFRNLERREKILDFIYVGLVAGSLHGLMNADWSSNQVFLVWIVFAGLLLGYISKIDNQNQSKYFSLWFNYTLLVFSILALIISIQYLRADIARVQGDIYFASKNYDGALNSYFLSLTYNSHDDLTWFKLWRVYFAMNRFELAKNSINKALLLSKYDGLYWSSMALCNQSLDESDEYKENIKKARKYLSP